MDIDDRYVFVIQPKIAFLKKTGGANCAILDQLSIMFEIPNIIERVHESWKDDSDKCRMQA